MAEQRQHYLALDALRGIAALSVVVFHLGHWLHHPLLAANANLSVDFFFCLSGYVLALAYRRKLDADMPVGRFMAIRLIRLMPLIVLATGISAAYFIARVFVVHDRTVLPGLGSAVVLGLVCLPNFMAPRPIGGPLVFPLNIAQYTLFLELVVNVVWAAARRLDDLTPALVIAGLSFVVSLLVGFGGHDVETFWHGFPRVFGSFYAGVAICHAQRRWPLLLGDRAAVLFVPLLAITAVIFYMPLRAPLALAWLWTVIASPALVAAGSRVIVSDRMRGPARLLGELSYPIYALHYPLFTWLNGGFQFAFHRTNIGVEGVLLIAAVTLGGWIVLRVIDEPVRGWLSRHVSSTGVRAAPAVPIATADRQA